MQHVDFEHVFINPSLIFAAACRVRPLEGKTDMLKLTGSVLALVVAFSLVPLAQGEAGNRSERHRIIKHNTFKMTDRSGRRHHRSVVRVVNRNVVVVKADGRNRHRYRPPVNTYSGNVVIDVRSGVGQWSYGAYSVYAAPVAAVAVPRVKIIDVGALKTNSACEMQAGVCVIRP